MAERKAAESVSSLTASRGVRSPVPATKKDDIEDVAWALQTAEAMWSRGDHGDALKWIRRAAEAASEAEADDRALELAKAAADVASLLADRPTTLAPPPPSGAPIPQAPPSPLITTTSRPPPPPTPVSPASASKQHAAAPTASKVAAAPAFPKLGQKGPTPARVGGAMPPSKRGGRRSSPSFTEETEVTKPHPMQAKARTSVTNETKRRGRPSKPSADETATHAPITARHPNASVEEIDAWPTQSILDEDDESNHTRIGEPAYQETAKTASARPPAPYVPPLVQTQAVRVVVWRGADGVHVAPAGTQVSAIAVEAILVAVDPGTDLAAWLSNK
jgi:hypothetical protein